MMSAALCSENADHGDGARVCSQARPPLILTERQ
jgi:hypothetical protein